MSLSRSHRRVCSTLLDNLVCTARVSLRTRRLCWSTEKCTCRVYCRRSRRSSNAIEEGCWCLQYTQPLTSHSPPFSSMLTTTTTTKSWRSDTLIILPGWECHTGGSAVKTHSTPVLPKREEAVGCSTSPQPRAQWLSHNTARNSASMSTCLYQRFFLLLLSFHFLFRDGT